MARGLPCPWVWPSSAGFQEPLRTPTMMSYNHCAVARSLPYLEAETEALSTHPLGQEWLQNQVSSRLELEAQSTMSCPGQYQQNGSTDNFIACTSRFVWSAFGAQAYVQPADRVTYASPCLDGIVPRKSNNQTRGPSQSVCRHHDIMHRWVARFNIARCNLK